MTDVTRGLAQSALVITIAVAVSRVFGLIRESVIAFQFGTSFAYDAYIIAFIIPHMLRMLLAEGALSAAFIPLFSDYLKQGRELADRFASNVLTIALILLPMVVLVGIWFAPYYIPILASGFDALQIELTEDLIRCTMPFIMLMGIAAVFMGIQNGHERFFAPAFASVFFNIGLIIGALFIAPNVNPPIMGLAIGVLIGGAGQLLFQIPFLRGIFRYKPRINLEDEGLKRLGVLMLPTMLGLVVVELNVVVDNTLASQIGNGQISSLHYAIRLFQLPLGLFGVAFATALLPRLSRFGDEDVGSFVTTLTHGLRMAALVILPAGAGLIALGEPIISLLFERGQFTAADTARTYYALGFLAIGLVGYGVGFTLTRAFYALKDTRTPVLISAIAVGINIALDFALVGPMGIGGLALATSIAGISQMLILAYVLQNRLQTELIAKVAPAFGAALLFSAIMGSAVWFSDLALGSVGFAVYARVAAGVVLGAAIYIALLNLAGLLGEVLESLPVLNRFVRKRDGS